MTNAFKAALLSGLVFPGLGQLVLKRYWRGVLLMFAVLAGLWIVITEALQRAFTLLQQIESAGGTIDMDTVLNAATQASGDYGNTVFRLAIYFVFGCWIFAVIDAWRIGKQTDRKEPATEDSGVGPVGQ